MRSARELVALTEAVLRRSAGEAAEAVVPVAVVVDVESPDPKSFFTEIPWMAKRAYQVNVFIER